MVKLGFFVTVLLVTALAALAPAATVTLQGATTGTYQLTSMSMDGQGNIVISVSSLGTPGAPTLSLAPTVLPAGTVNAPYAQSVTMSVANPAAGVTYTFGCSGSGTATGLSAAPDTSNATVCKISGTPAVAGTFTVTFTATDGTAQLPSLSISFNVAGSNPPPPSNNLTELTRLNKTYDIEPLAQKNFYMVSDMNMTNDVTVYLSTGDWSTNQDIYVSDKGNIDCTLQKAGINLPPNPSPWYTNNSSNTEKTRVYVSSIGAVPAGTTWYVTVCNRSKVKGKFMIYFGGS